MKSLNDTQKGYNEFILYPQINTLFISLLTNKCCNFLLFFFFFSLFALNFTGITPYEFSIVFISSFFIFYFFFSFLIFFFFFFFFEDIRTIIIHECNSRVKSEIVLRTLQNNPHNLSLRDSLISKEEKRRPPGAQSHPSYKRINGRLS